MIINGSQNMPCTDDSLHDVLYTARTLSRYGKCIVAVYEDDELIASFEPGQVAKRTKRVAV